MFVILLTPERFVMILKNCEDSTKIPLKLMKFFIFDCYFSLVINVCGCFCLYLEWKTIAEIFQPENQQILCGWNLFCRASQFFAVISLANSSVYDNPTWFQGWFGVVSDFFQNYISLLDL